MVEAENTIVLKSLEKARDSTERIKVLEEEKSPLFLAKGNNVFLHASYSVFCMITFYVYYSIYLLVFL